MYQAASTSIHSTNCHLHIAPLSDTSYFFKTLLAYSSHPISSNLSTLASTSFSKSPAYVARARAVSGDDAPIIRTASNPALVELAIPTVATGIPRYVELSAL